MTVYICDWTHWQEQVCPAKGIQREGYGMVKLKAGGASREGRYFEDPMFFSNAVALLDTDLIPAAYWYLMPGRAAAQAGLFYSMLTLLDTTTWAAFLDVEQAGVNWRDVSEFAAAWYRMTDHQPLALYTRQNFWQGLGAPMGLGFSTFPLLEEAHWVPATVRNDPTKPYASQQVKAVKPEWWTVGYGGWREATMLQFTDTALVQNKRTTASIYRGTRDDLQQLFGLA